MVVKQIIDNLLVISIAFSMISSLIVSKILTGSYEAFALSAVLTMMFSISCVIFNLVISMPLVSHYKIGKEFGWKTLLKINANEKKNLIIDNILNDKNNKNLVLLTFKVSSNIAEHFVGGNRVLTRCLNSLFNAYYLMAVKEYATEDKGIELRIIFDKNYLVKNDIDKNIIQEHLEKVEGKQELLNFFNSILKDNGESMKYQKNFNDDLVKFIREKELFIQMDGMDKKEVVRKRAKI